MKHTIGNFFSKTLLVAIVVITCSLAVFSQNDLNGGGRLAGTWDAVITLRDCETGAPGRSFASIANFNQGGTFLGSTSGQPQSSRTPEHGVWRHVGGNQYEFKFKSFNFDPAGNPINYVIIRHDLELDYKADTYTSAGEANVYLLNGVRVGGGCSSGVGTRFDF